MKWTAKEPLHPLIKYIRNWEAFNKAARKTNYFWFHIFISMLLAALLADILL